MMREKIHKNICGQSKKISDWYCNKLENLQFPIYSSYDIRDSGFKVSNVDANIYPAGFNNICQMDKDHSAELFTNYLATHYGTKANRILLVTEEHTQNPFYWENVITIKDLLEASGKQVLIAFPRALEKDLQLTSASGKMVKVVSGNLETDLLKEFKPDLIISNNDFSEPLEDWASKINIPINPPRELGWYQRKKSNYFKFYNELVSEFSEKFGFDSFQMNVKTELFENFDVTSETSKKELAEKVDHFLEELKQEYKKRSLNIEPVVFVKNNSGTYGLAVIRVASGKEILDWNYKSKKKMKAAKGGREVDEVIIQEGIPTQVQSDGITAEPVLYMIGKDLAGGFLRTHSEKSSTDSLNSPGAVYKRLCVSDLHISIEGSPLENVYGWTARLGLIAIAMEAKEMDVAFANWT
jgi:glutamate--cysteine ligase